MRIDKFLWSVRIFKTRSIASKACIAGKVKLNGKNIKPSRAVVTDNVLSVKKGAIEFQFKIITLLKTRVGAKLVSNYITNITSEAELDKLRNLKYGGNINRERGLGCPTKKD
ncbi:MAG TPA: RNA-binding S4 domain-containing protein, partial [Anaerolineae bacterium]|nr:RNA-binding S4 domain-containing protein [Anaerolineae bacterium]